MDIIVRVVNNGVTYDLDIQNDVPLRLDVSAVENGDIGNFFGVGSQAFDLPGTKTNNRFFKHGYEIGAEDIPAFYNAIDGYIIYDGETLLEGQFQLMEILTDESGFITYRCQITDSVVQFKDALASSLVKDADWSAYDHTLSNTNITASWDDNLLSGSVYYPVADYGRGDKDTYPTIPRLQLGTEVGAIGSPSSPLQPKQFLPAIKLKDVLDTLFDQVGFRYTGSFTERDDFNDMYILNKPNDELGVVVGEDSTATFNANSSTLNQVYVRNTEGDISASTEISDPLNAYNTSTSKYTYLDDGEYTLQGQVAFFNPVATDPASNVRVTLELRSGLNNTSYTLLDAEEINLTYLDGFGIKYLNVANSEGLRTTGDNAWLYLKYEQTAGGGTANNLTLIGSSVEFQCTSAPISYNGALVNMGLQWNPTLKSLDVVKGVIQQFNLVMTPKYGVNQTIEIEHFDDWIRMGQFKDWTEKYQTAQRIGINHTVNEQQRELLLKNVDDNDRFSKLSQENEPNFQYGTLRLLSDNNISQGKKTIGDFFAPVVMGGGLIPFETGSDGTPTFNVDLNTRFVLPHLYKYDNNKQQSFAFKPRIGYKVTNTLPSGSVINIGTTSDYVSVSGSYSTISNLSSLPAVSGSSFDLHFSNEYANFSFSNLGWDNGTTAHERYWKTYLDSLYWEDSRKITLDLEFSAYEYKSINLNDIVFIKNQRYRINKISGFNLTASDVVTVELIRLYPAYYTDTTIDDLDCGFDFNGITPTPTPPGFTATPTATPTSTPTPTPTTPPVSPISGAAWYSAQRDTESPSGEVYWTDPYTGTSVTRTFGTSATRYLLSTTEPTYEVGIDVNIGTPQYVNIYPTSSFDLSSTTEYTVSTGGAYWGYFSYYDTDTCQWVVADTLNFTADPYTINAATNTLVYDYPNWTITAGATGASGCAPTPTPTATPTATPTPTPEPTAPGVFYLNGTPSGFTTTSNACNGGTVGITTVYTSPSYQTIGNFSVYNTRFYTDAGLTTVFDGNGDYFGLSETNGSSPTIWAAIVGAGFLSGYGSC